MRYDWNTTLPIRAFKKVCGRMTYEGGGKDDGDDGAANMYAAQQQAQSSKENINTMNWANRPTINTPWGRQTWDTAAAIDPATGQAVTDWTQNINLTPEAQAALESQQRVTQGRSNTAESLLGQVADATKDPFNWAGMPETPGSVGQAQSEAYKTLSGNLQPGRDQQSEALRSRLLNSGLEEGSEAWKRAHQQLQDQWTTQDRNMQGQAMAEGRANVGTQQGIRSSGIAEEAQRRGMSLNELNALLTGQQVNMPSGMSQAPNTTSQAAQPLQALTAQQLTNQQAAQGGTDWGSAIGGIASIGSMFAPSDRRLKKNIVPLGDGWYEFEYIWGGGKHVGVMAQELMLTRPELVHVHPSGFLMVDYGGL